MDTQILYDRCPDCGKDLSKPVVYTFHRWATPSIIVLLSLMFLALDMVDGQRFIFQLEWAHWVILGLWILYITVQLLRFNPDYGWIIIPFGGILFNIFLFVLDYSNNTIAWAWYAIIPLTTFVIILPILARVSRDKPSHISLLRGMISKLEEDQ